VVNQTLSANTWVARTHRQRVRLSDLENFPDRYGPWFEIVESSGLPDQGCRSPCSQRCGFRYTVTARDSAGILVRTRPSHGLRTLFASKCGPDLSVRSR